MKRTMGRLAMGVVVAVLAMAAWQARAAELKIWMDEFKADFVPLVGSNSTRIVYQNPASAGVVKNGNEKTAWQGWAPVNLPLGSTIQSVVYYHGGSPGGSFTECQLWRVKWGANPQNLGSTIFGLGSAALVPVQLTPLENTLMIVKGYRYFVTAYADAGASIRGVKIIY